MYTLRGPDQQEHGPLSAPDVREWISQGRATRATTARADGEGRFRPLAQFIEFQVAFGAADMSLPPTLRGAPDQPSRAIAITAFALSAGGVFFFTALGGVVLGFIATALIQKRPREFGGPRYAVAAVFIGIAWLIAVPSGIYYGFHAMQRAMYQPKNNCHMHARSLATSLRIISIGNNGTFPDATSWCEAVGQEVTSTNHYRCPQDTNRTTCSFAYNAQISGVRNPDPQTVTLFESDLGWNGSGGISNMVAKPRHGGHVTMGFADGSVRTMTPDAVKLLQWQPHSTHQTGAMRTLELQRPESPANHVQNPRR